jgi:hypothetical protein
MSFSWTTCEGTTWKGKLHHPRVSLDEDKLHVFNLWEIATRSNCASRRAENCGLGFEWLKVGSAAMWGYWE